MSQETVESQSLLLATIIMVLIAIVIFFVQHFLVQVFDTAVEFFIFYIPATMLVMLYLKHKLRKSSR
ncbi:MAG: hypothetical protein ACQXXH_04555 [Candidatus Bathyarchaeia archaeon]